MEILEIILSIANKWYGILERSRHRVSTMPEDILEGLSSLPALHETHTTTGFALEFL